MVKNGGWTGRMLPSGVDTSSSWWLLCCRGKPSSVDWDASSAICASALRAVAVISATSMLVTDWTDEVELCREIPADIVRCLWSCSALSFSAMLCKNNNRSKVLTAELLIKLNKLAPYRTDGRLFTTHVCAAFKVMWHKNYDKYQKSGPSNLDIVP